MLSCVYSISVSSDANRTQVSSHPGFNTSTTEFTTPVDGSILFVIDQLSYPESADHGFSYTFSVDLSSIPTLKLPTNNGGENVLAFLQCSPHISIQTHQVRATGNGNLTLGKHQPSQGKYRFLSSKLSSNSHLLGVPN
jgi:hypothetical protein